MTKELISVVKRSEDRLFSYAQKAPEGLDRMSPAEAIRILRRKLTMTQAQLARRAGVSQSAIAQLEAGRGDPQWSTLTKIFNALYCNLMVIPKPRENLDKLTDNLMIKAMERQMKRLQGTMALEEQNVDPQVSEDIQREALKRRLKKRSSDIWED